MKDRKAFNFYRSYWETAKKLEGEDRLKFYDALLEKQFLNKDPKLEGLSDLVYTSQQHSIESQVSGYLSKIQSLKPKPQQGGTKGGIEGSIKPPATQEKVQEKVQGKEEGKEQIDFEKIFNSHFFIKVSQFFAQTLQQHKERVASIFAHKIEDGTFDEFEAQTNAYIDYKRLTKEKAHQWQSYLTQWDETNWIDMLKNEEQKEKDSVQKEKPKRHKLSMDDLQITKEDLEFKNLNQ